MNGLPTRTLRVAPPGHTGATCAKSKVFTRKSWRRRGTLACTAADGSGASVSTTTVTESGTESAAEETLELKAQVVTSIGSVGKEEWNACALGGEESNPFLMWDFLHAAEESGSACKSTGWLPQHITVRDGEGELLAACPVYLKGHSYGEYVFDQQWGNVAQKLGSRYYPKLQCAVPFTPVTGQRILVRAGANRAALTKAVAQTMVQFTEALQLSSFHMTFNTREEWEGMEAQGFMKRMGIQYHWENNGYETFDDFLMELKQSKRKSIRQERKSIAKQGLTCSRLTGDDIKPHHWDKFYEFYLNTVDQKWGQAYLKRDFFHMIGETMPEQIMLAVAHEGDDMVAGALNLVGSHALFGRNWGCEWSKNYKNLHFELCYYQALDEAIERGLARVEAGAQGEHKIQRGYLPSFTYSSHHIRDPVLAGVVGNFLEREEYEIRYALDMLRAEISPFKDPKPY